MTLEKTEDEILLEEVMGEIGYLFDEVDESTLQRIQRYINQGVALLEKRAGCPIALANPFERGLLINYCFYANARKANEFEVNYAEDLASLNADYNVQEKMNGSENDE